jgi:iron complex transport system permease protein
VDVGNVQKAGFMAASLITAAVVSVCGPIAFVGLIVPHTVRLLVGPDQRILIPASMFFGAAFLIACDTLARTVVAPTEIPVGVITAAIGGPFFVWLLKRRR